MESKQPYPGLLLGYTYNYALGDRGVYRKEDKIYASLSGEIVIDNNSMPPKISVKNESKEYMPKIGDEVYMKVTKVTKNVTMGDIIALKNKPIRVPIVGLIKYENVKKDYKDFDMFDCYCCGDVIFCKVISIDQSNYIYLSTQENNYGVVFGRSNITNNLMMPVAFDKMLCLDTKIHELRKVAKPNYI